MQYRTITLGMIQELPELYEQLRSRKMLLTAMDAYASDLKAGHEAWKDRIASANPTGDPRRIASEALELAIQDLQRRLLSASPNDEAEPLSLDDAMAFIRQATPTV